MLNNYGSDIKAIPYDFSALNAGKASFGVSVCLQQLTSEQEAKRKRKVEIWNPVKMKKRGKCTEQKSNTMKTFQGKN